MEDSVTGQISLGLRSKLNVVIVVHFIVTILEKKFE